MRNLILFILTAVTAVCCSIAQGQQAIDLETLKAQLPFASSGWLAQLLYPAAGLGGQSTSHGTAKGTQLGAQTGFKLGNFG